MQNCSRKFSFIPNRQKLYTASCNWPLEYGQIIHLKLFISVYNAAVMEQVKETREEMTNIQTAQFQQAEVIQIKRYEHD
jgi:hypothetical protein